MLLIPSIINGMDDDLTPLQKKFGSSFVQLLEKSNIKVDDFVENEIKTYITSGDWNFLTAIADHAKTQEKIVETILFEVRNTFTTTETEEIAKSWNTAQQWQK
jgi:hypothetical protein